MPKTRTPMPADLDYGPLHGLAGHLLRHAFNLGQDAFAESFNDEEVTPLRFMIMTLIIHNPGIAHQEICAAMGTAASVITTSIKPLLSHNFLSATKDENDRRRIQYNMTEAGKSWHQGNAHLLRQSEDRLLAKLNMTQRQEFIALLQCLTGIAVSVPSPEIDR